MNLEQVEGQMAEYERQMISVVIPIRGTIRQMFLGELYIRHNWIEHIISYEIGLYPNTVIAFQAQDVQKITSKPHNQLAAEITLKSDTWLEQSKYNNV